VNHGRLGGQRRSGQRFVREYTDALVRNGATLVRAVRRTADETLRPLEEQLAQQRYQNAAE
jgi:hypothetical protein